MSQPSQLPTQSENLSSLLPTPKKASTISEFIKLHPQVFKQSSPSTFKQPSKFAKVVSLQASARSNSASSSSSSSSLPPLSSLPPESNLDFATFHPILFPPVEDHLPVECKDILLF
jgi:hypothetical protein